MVDISDFTTIGNPVGDIDVRLSYKIVQLFSEGLYASPNKAIEELVANSFDAGAQRVAASLTKEPANKMASARSIRSRPLTVIRSGSPGPAPTNQTVPVVMRRFVFSGWTAQ